VALTYQFDSQQGWVTITRSHHPTFEEWRAFMERLLGDPQYRPGATIVEDRREDRDVPSRNEVEIVSAWIRANATRLGESRWAVILDPGALAAFGMMRVGEFLTDRSGVTLRAFTSPETARAWASGAALAE
jgi:hypothetical protein